MKFMRLNRRRASAKPYLLSVSSHYMHFAYQSIDIDVYVWYNISTGVKF